MLLPGSTLGFLFFLHPSATGGTRETALLGKHERSTILMLTKARWQDLRRAHPELERLMKDGMIRRIAHEYHHWVCHHDHRGGPERPV